jgi:ABC-type nitrate/sulfonate/bicarbonate transport system ATPase subunit
MKIPYITIKNVSKSYPKSKGKRRVEVLKDITLTVKKGEFLVLLGPSGCGKSTFLRILAQLDTKTAGTIEYGEGYNQDNISFVFQNFGVLPWLTISKNVELALIGRGIEVIERLKRVDEVLEELGLAAFKDRYPHELSGGMRQRVGLARAFVTRPEVIFLDEPFSELDFFTAKNLRGVLSDMWQKYGTTIIMVSHYIDEAVLLSDRIAVFGDRPSSIIHVFENNVARPRDHRSKAFYEMEDAVLAVFENQK